MSDGLSPETLEAVEAEIGILRDTNPRHEEVYGDHPAVGLLGLKIHLDEFVRTRLGGADSAVCLDKMRQMAAYLLCYLDQHGCPLPAPREVTPIEKAKNNEVFEANLERLKSELNREKGKRHE